VKQSKSDESNRTGVEREREGGIRYLPRWKFLQSSCRRLIAGEGVRLPGCWWIRERRWGGSSLGFRSLSVPPEQPLPASLDTACWFAPPPRSQRGSDAAGGGGGISLAVGVGTREEAGVRLPPGTNRPVGGGGLMGRVG
jgi:hypothetical protein